MDPSGEEKNGSPEHEQENNGNGTSEALPPPPPSIPPNVTPIKVEGGEPVIKKKLRIPMARRGMGTEGLITLKWMRKVLMASSSTTARVLILTSIIRVYDTSNKLEFTVVLEDVTSNRNNGNSSPGGKGSPNDADRKRIRHPYHSKTFKVEISYAAKIPMQAIGDALRGKESENSQEAIRVLDIILRQHAAKLGCLLVRQSYFHYDPRNFTDVGGGVLGCRGFHNSFRTTQGGLSLNIVVDFLIANQCQRSILN